MHRLQFKLRSDRGRRGVKSNDDAFISARVCNAHGRYEITQLFSQLLQADIALRVLRQGKFDFIRHVNGMRIASIFNIPGLPDEPVLKISQRNLINKIGYDMLPKD
jgi:hypothetical protein